MLRFLSTLFQAPPPIAGRPDLVDFVAGTSAFLSQKCTVEYCRARSGLNWDKLFKEESFRSALEVCRWEAFGAVMLDLALVIEGRLRPSAVERELDLANALQDVVASALATYPPPTHREDGWDGLIEECGRRLHAALLAAPRTAGDIGYAAGNRIFEVLPIHKSLRGHDRMLIVNNVRMGLTQTAEQMHRRFDAPALVRDLVGP